MNRCARRTAFFSLSLAAATLAFAPALLQEEVKSPTAVPAGEDQTRIDQWMETIEEGMETLRKSVRDPALFGESIEVVEKMVQAAAWARTETPKMAANVAEGERAAFVRAYRKEMIELLVELLRLEAALLEGNTEDAQKIYKNLKKMEEAGHERFTDGE